MRWVVGRDGVVINIIDVGQDNKMVVHRRHAGHAEDIDCFLDTTTGETWAVGDLYDKKDLQIADLRTQEPTLWVILHALANRLNILEGVTSGEYTDEEFIAYARQLLGT